MQSYSLNPSLRPGIVWFCVSELTLWERKLRQLDVHRHRNGSWSSDRLRVVHCGLVATLQEGVQVSSQQGVI